LNGSCTRPWLHSTLRKRPGRAAAGVDDGIILLHPASLFLFSSKIVKTSNWCTRHSISCSYISAVPKRFISRFVSGWLHMLYRFDLKLFHHTCLSSKSSDVVAEWLIRRQTAKNLLCSLRRCHHFGRLNLNPITFVLDHGMAFVFYCSLVVIFLFHLG
jgi:hypothetical protein